MILRGGNKGIDILIYFKDDDIIDFSWQYFIEQNVVRKRNRLIYLRLDTSTLCFQMHVTSKDIIT